jgi:uncharacterized protein (TIGR00725 family)
VRTVIGVMGSGAVLDRRAEEDAYLLGRLIAEQGWALLNGGRPCGVMDATARGAHDAGGLVVGVLPDEDASVATPHLDIAIVTGMRDARNYVNALSSQVVVALPGKAGTLSEVALALNAGRTVVAVGWDVGPALGDYAAAAKLIRVETPEEAVMAVRNALAKDAG